MPALASPVDRQPDRHLLHSPDIRRAQRRHAVIVVLLPLLACLSGPWWLPGSIDPLLAVASFAFMSTLAAGFGVSVGFHRHFAHRSFHASPWVRKAMVVAGQMAAQGPLLYWTALHRRHHAFADKPGDPHSPVPAAQARPVSAARAFWHGHMGWSVDHGVPMPTRYVADLLADKPIRRLSNAYLPCVLAGLLLPATLGALWGALFGGALQGALTGLYFGGFLRLAVCTQSIWGINSVCHRFGTRPHDTGDHSTNHLGMGLLTYGEGWHNNHHHAPTLARFGFGWRQPDAAWVMIAALRRLGWAWDVRDGRATQA